MTRPRKKPKEDVRFRVLRLLADNPEISQRELARSVGISLGSAHYCLSALADAGLVKLQNFSAAKDKRRYAYILTPAGFAEKTSLAHQFLRRKRAEYRALRDEIESLQDELGREGEGRLANRR
jgi:EPS-associated MarR family transcriptional regulator